MSINLRHALGGSSRRYVISHLSNIRSFSTNDSLSSTSQSPGVHVSKHEEIDENNKEATIIKGPKKPRFDPYPVVYHDGTPEQQAAAKTFAKLGLSTPLIKYMSNRFDHPLPIQESAVPMLIKGTSALLTSQTGSGKTLAYMLPLIVRMQASEAKRSLKPEESYKKGPRVVVLSPTRELSTQLITQAKSISHIAKFRARIWGNDMSKKDDTAPPDLVVTSTRAFDREMKWPISSIESIVLDECDVLLDPKAGFLEDIVDIVHRVKPETQIVCVGATALKNNTKKWLESIRPDFDMVKVDGVGDIPPTIKVHMISVKAEEGYNKHPALERALAPFLSFPKHDKTNAHHPRCIVFCNSVASCRSTAHLLDERFNSFASSYCLHGEMKPKQREESFAGFVAEEGEPGLPKRPKVLVCTDLSSRGIDVQNVQHVVIFDIPNNILDFLHRAGRTGRAGKQGEVTFIVGRGEKEKLMEVLQVGRQTMKTNSEVYSRSSRPRHG